MRGEHEMLALEDRNGGVRVWLKAPQFSGGSLEQRPCCRQGRRYL
jgi:hypothetical protein